MCPSARLCTLAKETSGVGRYTIDNQPVEVVDSEKDGGGSFQ